MAEAGEFIQIDSKGGTNSIFLSTASVDLAAPRLHGGIDDETWIGGRIFEGVTLEQTADISGGQGFLSEPPSGTIVIADDDGALAQTLLDETWAIIGGTAYIGSRDTAGVMRKLYQVAILEAGLDSDGAVSLSVRGPSALADTLMHGSAATEQLITNELDPEVLTSESLSVSAGTAFGGVPVSLRSGKLLETRQASYYTRSVFRSGAISGGGEEAFVSYRGARRVTRHTYNADGEILTVGAVFFDCRGSGSVASDTTERNRLEAEIQAFISAGYRFVISNGTWFVDVTLNTGGQWAIIPYPVGISTLATSGATWGTYWNSGDGLGYLGIWVVLANAEGDELYAQDALDPAQIGMYFIPPSIPVARHQVAIDGAASEGATIPIPGELSTRDGITSLSPQFASDQGIYSVQPIRDIGLVFVSPGVFDPVNPGSTISGTGSIDDIKTNPDDRFAGGTAPIEITSSDGSASEISAALRVKPTTVSAKTDFVCVESTWDADATMNLSGPSQIKIWEPLATNPVLDRTYTIGGQILFSGAANIARKTPNWKNMIMGSAIELETSAPPLSPAIQAGDCWYTSMRVYECFLYGFSKISFNSIYSTVYPFWTRKSCASLAYGAGTIIAGGVGRGTGIQASGAITWAPFDLPVSVGEVATVTGTAYGTLGATPFWVSVGTLTSGSTSTPACWISDDDGVTWRRDTTFDTASPSTNIRFVNGRFVVTRADGSISIAAGFSLPNLIWSEVATGATQLNDIAFGSGRYLLVGNGDQARYSMDLASFTNWNASTGDDLLCACYAQGSVGGFFHVGYGSASPGSTGGTIYRKYDGSVPTWTTSDPGTDAIRAITATASGDVVAVMSNGVYGQSLSGADTSWKFRYFLGENSPLAGVVSFLVGTSPLVVVGGPAQIVTSPFAYQGALAEASGYTPEWTPWATKTPSMALDHLITRNLGGYQDNLNPIRYSMRPPLFQAFGIAFDPPSTNSDDPQAGTTALQAARKICEEWWAFAGEMPVTKIDGTADAIEAALPDVKMGNREDVYTQITTQFQPFGGEYLGKAYIQNVDVAYVAGNDALYFAGWDVTGNAVGLALWTACRDAYLATGILRETSRTYDSVQDAGTMGALWNVEDFDLGWRILWLCKQPRYYRITVAGNNSAAALAFNGCRYKPNPLFLTQRGLSLGITGYGVVVENSHDVVAARHELLIAFPPEQP